jgi:hypothetical protein
MVYGQSRSNQAFSALAPATTTDDGPIDSHNTHESLPTISFALLKSPHITQELEVGEEKVVVEVTVHAARKKKTPIWILILQE